MSDSPVKPVDRVRQIFEQNNQARLDDERQRRDKIKTLSGFADEIAKLAYNDIRTIVMNITKRDGFSGLEKFQEYLESHVARSLNERKVCLSSGLNLMFNRNLRDESDYRNGFWHRKKTLKAIKVNLKERLEPLLKWLNEAGYEVELIVDTGWVIADDSSIYIARVEICW